MATLHTMGRPSGLPLSLLSQAIHRLSRAELEDLAQSLIDHMDAIDGDPDLEDGNDREASNGDDKDIAWLEWSGLTPNHLRTPHQSWGGEDTAAWMGGPSEDDEDDDPAGQCDEDGINTCSSEANLHSRALSVPGCAIAEDAGDAPEYGINQTANPLDGRPWA